jgi:two-component system response regulator FixJ
MAAERTVHVIDDDEAVRRSLDRLLTAAGFRVACYAAVADFLAVAARLRPGCVLLDLRMPDMDGLQLQSRLLELEIPLPVVVMTGQGDVPSAVSAMKLGAVDFIEKPYSDHVLIVAVEAALARAGRPSRSREAEQAAERIAQLSPRERQVLDALVAGHSNKVIAFDLGLSVRTVEVHRARMLTRLGVRQFADAIRLAVLARMAASRLTRSYHDQ